MTNELSFEDITEVVHNEIFSDLHLDPSSAFCLSLISQAFRSHFLQKVFQKIRKHAIDSNDYPTFAALLSTARGNHSNVFRCLVENYNFDRYVRLREKYEIIGAILANANWDLYSWYLLLFWLIVCRSY
jgi:hypothetical protein